MTEIRGTDEQPLSDKPPLTVPDSSNLKTQHKVVVKEIKEKSATFCFFKLKAKEKVNFSKIIKEMVTFL